MERVAIIGLQPHVYPDGGFEVLSVHLTQRLNESVRFTLYSGRSLFTVYPKKDMPVYEKTVVIPFAVRGLQRFPFAFFALLHALFTSDTLLIKGSGCSLFLPLIRLLTRKKIVIHFDRIEWKQPRKNSLQRWYLKRAERRTVRWAHVLVSDNESIRQYFAGAYNLISELIEYGSDHVRSVKPTASDKIHYPFMNRPYAFVHAELRPENHPELVLKAFADSNVDIVFIANWQSHSYGRKLVGTYSKYPHIHLLEIPETVADLQLLKSNCWVYIHGNQCSGTHPSLVEAMQYGLPVIAFDVAANKETTDYKALYFKDIKDLRDLIPLLGYSQLQFIGQTMKQIALRQYNWNRIARKYLQLFRLPVALISKRQFLRRKSDAETQFLREVGLSHLIEPRHYFEDPETLDM